MKKKEFNLVGAPGCEGCRKKCIYNGLTTDRDRAEDQPKDKYGCNSSKLTENGRY